MKQEEQNSQAVYFKSLTIEGINCFKSEQTIDLTDGEGNPAMWTVILGNNNTGKTTLLRCLALLESEYNSTKNTYSLRAHYTVPHNTTNPRIQATLNININSDWSYSELINPEGIFINKSISEDKRLKGLAIDAYGTQRKQGNGTFMEYELNDRTESLFRDNVSFLNPEEWFLGTKLDALLGNHKSSEYLDLILKTLIHILPDIKGIEIGGDKRRVYFITNGGSKVLKNHLGLGYQSLITWIVDLAKRMFDRYPKSDKPLKEPAIVLVDEIDLHLHPEWQRKIVSFLSKTFPKTQFIVTAHSPLVIQSANDINVVVLHKNEDTDEVSIYQPKETNFQGWTVEEILSDLMQMGDNVYSDKYLKWMKQFDKALDTDNYQKATEAYEELSKMVYSPATLKMLRIQMSSLMPESHD
jgi:predicted ATP-dependent endonuclease of OLD family